MQFAKVLLLITVGAVLAAAEHHGESHVKVERHHDHYDYHVGHSKHGYAYGHSHPHGYGGFGSFGEHHLSKRSHKATSTANFNLKAHHSHPVIAHKPKEHHHAHGGTSTANFNLKAYHAHPVHH